MFPEIRRRATSTADTLRILRTRVFSPSALADGTRMQFADSLVMSGRLYNAGIWPSLTLGESRQVETEVMKVYRAAAKVRFVETDSCVSNTQVLARLQGPPRECFFGRLGFGYWARYCILDPEFSLHSCERSGMRRVKVPSGLGPGWDRYSMTASGSDTPPPLVLTCRCRSTISLPGMVRSDRDSLPGSV